MKFKVTCKLPTEIPIGLGIGLVGLLMVIGVYYGLLFMVNIYGAAIVAAGSGLLAAIVENVNLVFIGCIALVCALIGWFMEESYKGEDEGKRSVEILFAMAISTILSLYPAFHFTSDLGTGKLVFSWLIFIEGIFILTGGFTVGWLGHWCKRCIRIEPDGKTQAGGENL